MRKILKTIINKEKKVSRWSVLCFHVLSHILMIFKISILVENTN